MKIRFYNIIDNSDAAFENPDAKEFLINKDGNVVEFVEQGFAGFYAHFLREDVSFEIIERG